MYTRLYFISFLAMDTNQPTKAAFMAKLSSTITNCGENDHVIFDNVVLNEGSGYDVRHGILRAPMYVRADYLQFILFT